MSPTSDFINCLFFFIIFQLVTMEPNDSWDSIRTLRMAGFGLIILGPAQHSWFNFVGRVLPKRDMLTTFKKLAMGQVLFGPMINGSFFSFNAALQGTMTAIYVLQIGKLDFFCSSYAFFPGLLTY